MVEQKPEKSEYVDNQKKIIDLKIKNRKYYLFISSIFFRLIIVFGFIPLIHVFWNKKSHAHHQNNLGGYVGKAISYLKSFDAEHMLYVSKHGYNQEKNHAFFPAYPMLLASFGKWFGAQYVEYVAFLTQLLIGALNSVLLYNFGIKILNNQFFALGNNNHQDNGRQEIDKYKRSEQISFGAAVLYNFNQTLIYSISMYSESLFVFMLLLGLNVLHYGDDSKLQTKRNVLAAFFFNIATMTRSTGSLNAIIPLFYTAHKMVRAWFKLTKPGTEPKQGCCNRCRRFNKSVKYLFLTMGVADTVVFIPILTITVWKPYEMYCLSRLDTYYDVPNWCYDRLPNVYNYIQGAFWQVGWLGFLDRPWYLTAVSVFTNQLFFYMLYKMISGQGLIRFFTLGLFDTVKTESAERKVNVFKNLAALPHAYIFMLNMLVIFLVANSEINSRVASTCPFYFLAFSQLIIETKEEMESSKESNNIQWYKHFVVMISLIYNSVVLMLNLVLFTVEIGFI